jgi:hypothetical protein
MAPRYDVVNGGVTMKKGWRTDAASKNELVSGVREWLIERRGALNSRRLVGELMTFVRTRSGKPEAKAGCHDDGVIVLGIAIQVDLLAPMDQDLLEGVRKEEARDMTSVMGRAFEVDPAPKMTVEEKCFAHAMGKRMEREVREEDLWGQVEGETVSDW